MKGPLRQCDSVQYEKSNFTEQEFWNVVFYFYPATSLIRSLLFIPRSQLSYSLLLLCGAILWFAEVLYSTY